MSVPPDIIKTQSAELDSVLKQIKRWDTIAKIVPTTCVMASLGIIALDIVPFNQLYIIGLTSMAVTSLSWWFWALLSVKTLSLSLLRTNDNFTIIIDEFIAIRDEVTTLKHSEDKCDAKQ